MGLEVEISIHLLVSFPENCWCVLLTLALIASGVESYVLKLEYAQKYEHKHTSSECYISRKNESNAPPCAFWLN